MRKIASILHKFCRIITVGLSRIYLLSTTTRTSLNLITKLPLAYRWRTNPCMKQSTNKTAKSYNYRMISSGSNTPTTQKQFLCAEISQNSMPKCSCSNACSTTWIQSPWNFQISSKIALNHKAPFLVNQDRLLHPHLW